MGKRVKGARSCMGVSCAAVAMGVIQAKYSTYILVLQLYITGMQTAVFTKKSYHYHQRFSRYRRFNFAPILGLIAHLVLRCAKKTWLQALLCKSYNVTYRFIADINSEKIIRNFNVILILFPLLTYNSRKGYVRSELSLVSCDQPSLV